jgi:hypothetical protein
MRVSVRVKEEVLILIPIKLWPLLTIKTLGAHFYLDSVTSHQEMKSSQVIGTVKPLVALLQGEISIVQSAKN